MALAISDERLDEAARHVVTTTWGGHSAGDYGSNMREAREVLGRLAESYDASLVGTYTNLQIGTMFIEVWWTVRGEAGSTGWFRSGDRGVAREAAIELGAYLRTLVDPESGLNPESGLPAFPIPPRTLQGWPSRIASLHKWACTTDGTDLRDGVDEQAMYLRTVRGNEQEDREWVLQQEGFSEPTYYTEPAWNDDRVFIDAAGKAYLGLVMDWVRVRTSQPRSVTYRLGMEVEGEGRPCWVILPPVRTDPNRNDGLDVLCKRVESGEGWGLPDFSHRVDSATVEALVRDLGPYGYWWGASGDFPDGWEQPVKEPEPYRLGPPVTYGTDPTVPMQVLLPVDPARNSGQVLAYRPDGDGWHLTTSDTSVGGIYPDGDEAYNFAVSSVGVASWWWVDVLNLPPGWDGNGPESGRYLIGNETLTPLGYRVRLIYPVIQHPTATSVLTVRDDPGGWTDHADAMWLQHRDGLLAAFPGKTFWWVARRHVEVDPELQAYAEGLASEPVVKPTPEPEPEDTVESLRAELERERAEHEEDMKTVESVFYTHARKRDWCGEVEEVAREHLNPRLHIKIVEDRNDADLDPMNYTVTLLEQYVVTLRRQVEVEGNSQDDAEEQIEYGEASTEDIVDAVRRGDWQHDSDGDEIRSIHRTS